MSVYEYKIVPAPARSLKFSGLGRGDDPVALTLEATMNEVGAAGWEFVRTDRIAMRRRRWFRTEERASTVLVFRRLKSMPRPRRAVIMAGDEIGRARTRRPQNDALVEAVRQGERRIVPQPRDTEARAANDPGAEHMADVTRITAAE